MQSFHTRARKCHQVWTTWYPIFGDLVPLIQSKPSQGVSWCPLMVEAWFGRAALRRGPPSSLESPVRQHNPKPPHRSCSSKISPDFEAKSFCHPLHRLRTSAYGVPYSHNNEKYVKKTGCRSVGSHLTVESPQSRFC